MTTVVWTSENRPNVSTSETPTGSFNSSTAGWELNSTEQATSSDPLNEIPIVGYPGPLFTAIHVAALTSLSLSTVVVTILLIYLCGFSGSVKNHSTGTTGANGKRAVSKRGEYAVANIAAQWKKTRLSFWKWNIGERFVVYLGACDLCQTVSHILDHAYIFYAKDNPPERICVAFAFFLHNFIFCQWFLILATAVSACSLIVFGRKMSLGRFDWRLFAFALGGPTIVSVTALSLGLLGASGAWCLIKYGAHLYTQITNTFQIILFGLIGVAYGSIWIKIQRTTKLMKGSTTERYQNSAKVMMIFVAVFILQWWPYIIYNIWSFFADPPPTIIILAVIFVNIGGVFNTIAYTILRRRLQRQKHQNAVASNDNSITNTASTNSTGAAPCTVSAAPAEHAPGGSQVPDVREVSDVPPDVLDDPEFASQVTKAWSAPIVPGVSQIAQIADEDQRPDSDAGKTEDAIRIPMHTHL